MRTAEIFDGKEFIEVEENDIFRLDNQWPGKVGSIITYILSSNTTVTAKVISDDGLGTDLQIIKIDRKFNKSNTPLIIFKTYTKSKLIDVINTFGLDINTKQTKAKILEDLEKLNNVNIL